MNLWLVLLGAAGFLISFYIYHTKTNDKQLVCIIGKGCNAVVESKYNRLMGVPNEVIGMFYYAAIAVTSFFVLTGILATTRLLITACAAIAGIGLLGIQAFVLKKWCEYCVASTLISVAIFVLAFF